LVIAFDGFLDPLGLTEEDLRHKFIVEAESGEGNRTCWCQLQGKYRFGKLTQECNARSNLDDGAINALEFIPSEQFVVGRHYRVHLLGDLIEDLRGRAVDGNHLPPWVPKRRSGDRIEGGTFESFFVVSRD
jgi:hypothetical protein